MIIITVTEQYPTVQYFILSCNKKLYKILITQFPDTINIACILKHASKYLPHFSFNINDYHAIRGTFLLADDYLVYRITVCIHLECTHLGKAGKPEAARPVNRPVIIANYRTSSDRQNSAIKAIASRLSHFSARTSLLSPPARIHEIMVTICNCIVN